MVKAKILRPKFQIIQAYKIPLESYSDVFKVGVSGGEFGAGFPRMVLLFLPGTIITSNGHILDRHFRGKKRLKINSKFRFYSTRAFYLVIYWGFLGYLVVLVEKKNRLQRQPPVNLLTSSSWECSSSPTRNS